MASAQLRTTSRSGARTSTFSTATSRQASPLTLTLVIRYPTIAARLRTFPKSRGTIPPIPTPTFPRTSRSQPTQEIRVTTILWLAAEASARSTLCRYGNPASRQAMDATCLMSPSWPGTGFTEQFGACALTWTQLEQTVLRAQQAIISI